MHASVHILCGPAASGKTQRLLTRFREVAAKGIGTALWLGPLQRYVESIREQLAGCLAPRLFTFQDFADEIVRVNDQKARPLSHVQRRLLLADIVAEMHSRGALKHFDQVADSRGFAEALFALV